MLPSPVHNRPRRQLVQLKCRAQLAGLGWLRAWRGYCPGQEFDARRSARLGSRTAQRTCPVPWRPRPGTCPSWAATLLFSHRPRREHRRHRVSPLLPGRPPRQRSPARRLRCPPPARRLSRRLHIALVPFALHPFLQRLHLGRRVGLNGLPLGVGLVRRLVRLAVDGFPRGISLCLGGGHPCLDLLVSCWEASSELLRSATWPAAVGHRPSSSRQPITNGSSSP